MCIDAKYRTHAMLCRLGIAIAYRDLDGYLDRYLDIDIIIDAAAEYRAHARASAVAEISIYILYN